MENSHCSIRQAKSSTQTQVGKQGNGTIWIFSPPSAILNWCCDLLKFYTLKLAFLNVSLFFQNLQHIICIIFCLFLLSIVALYIRNGDFAIQRATDYFKDGHWHGKETQQEEILCCLRKQEALKGFTTGFLNLKLRRAKYWQWVAANPREMSSFPQGNTTLNSFDQWSFFHFDTLYFSCKCQ